MIVVSDTNILSSFAAGSAFEDLLRLFVRTTIHVPPSVHDELQVGIGYGKGYLHEVVDAITDGKIVVLELTEREQGLLPLYPRQLNLGEQEAIAIVEARQGILLSNDRRAVRYCQQRKLSVSDLGDVLRLFWTRATCRDTRCGS